MQIDKIHQLHRIETNAFDQKEQNKRTYEREVEKRRLQ